ncbi:MAG: cytochrome c oxidase subunit II [Planctomycetes bacterium RBG_16_59_8]|nr:MAG: cytochrome c oxidase subunit II [Planctomycetes bacterium RBG_16_59_8]
MISTLLNVAPQRASNIAREVDSAFLLITAISVAMLIGITLCMIYFVIRYSRTRNPNPSMIEGHKGLELLWTVVPTILVLGMFYYGWRGFDVMRSPPVGAMEVHVVARKWSWLFEYTAIENGKTKTVPSEVLVLPIGKPVKLLLRSEDVIHSLFIPEFRVKEDAVPGTPTWLWFIPEREGTFEIFCAEYCGLNHSRMRALVQVVSAKAFEEFTAKPVPPRLVGRTLVRSVCASCHSLDGAPSVGPTFKGLLGRKSAVKENGKPLTVEVTEDYIRESIREPNRKIVDGFPANVMQVQNLSDADVAAILEYLRTIHEAKD